MQYQACITHSIIRLVTRSGRPQALTIRQARPITRMVRKIPRIGWWRPPKRSASRPGHMLCRTLSRPPSRLKNQVFSEGRGIIASSDYEHLYSRSILSNECTAPNATISSAGWVWWMANGTDHGKAAISITIGGTIFKWVGIRARYYGAGLAQRNGFSSKAYMQALGKALLPVYTPSTRFPSKIAPEFIYPMPLQSGWNSAASGLSTGPPLVLVSR
ncbi:uncharacterized protein BCR38DRAFT_9522 [Pseudomassariella vexata]|uniref:Uncharacterized protein n=1 Tax=Pseudomassariella vexata TaxID=1141098 RepID=A0A1Y2EIK3_9PEZI|nr:uncharacterized protein BCR38DRAFT_9522 [Pseudomassariella vexata]ORY71393.1 hypothetical protein BCR38DRAFT_9522 [Pseudomassariella vexata]